MNKNEHCYYSWIPTNLGSLKLEFIDKKNIENSFCVIDKKDFTKTQNKISIKMGDIKLQDDNNRFARLFVNKEKSYFDGSIHIEKKKNFEGNITLIAVVDKSKNLKIEYKANFIIDTRGKIKITTENELQIHIVEAIYTIIKKVFHSDSHHAYKIDTLVGVSKEFNPTKIAENISLGLKRIDYFLKNTDTEKESLSKSSLYKLKDLAYGQLSYLKTFTNIYLKNDDTCVKNATNVCLSIKSKLNIIEKENSAQLQKYNYITILIAMFISINILYNSFIPASKIPDIFLQIAQNNKVKIVLEILHLSGREALTVATILFLMFMYRKFIAKFAYSSVEAQSNSTSWVYELKEACKLLRHSDNKKMYFMYILFRLIVIALVFTVGVLFIYFH